VIQAKARQPKSSKGSVQIKSSHDRLQLVFSHAGKRRYLSMGIQDTPLSRKIAEMAAHQIELDILSGNFDNSLAKYKRELTSDPEEITPVFTPIAAPALTPQQLWERYNTYKALELKETTKHYHATLGRLFGQLDATISVLDPLKVKASLEKITTVHQTKRCLMQLSAACKWAQKYDLLDENPYEGMANSMPKYRYQVEPKPNSFSEAEREQILEAFRSDERKGMTYRHYAPFVEFLFLTGCRPSEAVGLQWKHIAADHSKIHFTGSVATYRPIRIEGSKNNKKRWFPCSERLTKLLQSLRPNQFTPETPVFPSPKGNLINYNNFCNTPWNRIVDPIKPHTTPYSCRDTFITLQIMKGTPVTAIAQWCDTSVEMIQTHYADRMKLLTLKPID
jgi:integrase